MHRLFGVAAAVALLGACSGAVSPPVEPARSSAVTGTADVPPTEAGPELPALAADHAAGRQPLPVLELIATVVHSKAGADGTYRTRQRDEVIAEHLAAARAVQGYLLLNIQPGRAAFLDEVKALEPWLREPDVGVALDPEWAVGPGQVPGRVYGSVTGATLDSVAAYLSGLVAAHRLPEKLMVCHQLTPRIVRGPEQLGQHPGVALVVSVDGIGAMADKIATWNRVLAVVPSHVHRGSSSSTRRTRPGAH